MFRSLFNAEIPISIGQTPNETPATKMVVANVATHLIEGLLYERLSYQRRASGSFVVGGPWPLVQTQKDSKR